MGCGGGGVNILWYNILTPPPKNILEQYLYMESSDNLALTHKIFTFHRQYYSVVELSFFMGCGGRVVNILWYNILTPPPPKNIQEHFFVNGIQ